jgi:hypothetical protein
MAHYAFKVCYRGRLISVRVTQSGAPARALTGEPLDIRSMDYPPAWTFRGVALIRSKINASRDLI